MPSDPIANPTPLDKMLASPPGSWRRERAERPKTQELRSLLPGFWEMDETIEVSPALIWDAINELSREIYRLAEMVESLGGDPATPGSEEVPQEELERLARK